MAGNRTNRGDKRGGGGGQGRNSLSREVQVSKKLSWLLRHGAAGEHLELGPGGYANLGDVLNNRHLRSLQVGLAEVREIVRDNDKQRFALVPANAPDDETTAATTTMESTNPRDYLIRANQGHSLQVDTEGLLTPIATAADAPPTVVHGTTHAAWPRIVASGGLKPMRRTHVHFATGLPAGFKSLGETTAAAADADGGEVAPPVVSGMRVSSTVLVFVDVAKALERGIKFWRAENNVILSEGNEAGLVPLEVFKRVEDRTGEGILVEDGKVVKDAPATWAAAKGRGKG